MSKLFTSQTSLSSSPVTTDRTLTVWGRKLIVPESTETVAKFPFEKLCGEPLSSADYLEITAKFEVIFVEDVPELGMDRKDMVRRSWVFRNRRLKQPLIDAFDRPESRLGDSSLSLTVSLHLPVKPVYRAKETDHPCFYRCDCSLLREQDPSVHVLSGAHIRDLWRRPEQESR
jgi:hypothetical protein